MLTPRQKADNAIKWIDALPVAKQAPFPRGVLGDSETGFCCLGVGAELLGANDYSPKRKTSLFFSKLVGLMDKDGCFYPDNKTFYGGGSLTYVNDHTGAGFKRISKLMKTHPDWMFEAPVAELIKEHYS